MRRSPFEDALSFVVFPFLRTSEAVSVGEFTFRPVDDPGFLSGEDLVRLGEISKMFFLLDDKRIVTPTYCTVPHINFDHDKAALERLSDIQAVIAYFYATPHEVFGNPFLRYEDLSLVILTPDEVSSYLVNPDRFVEQVGEYLGPEPQDDLSGVPGYSGLYNFRERFWCIRTSRIYPPGTWVTLNVWQDLRFDLYESSPRRGPVLGLLNQPENLVSRRVATAIKWYNRANERSASEEVAIVHLATAFETLLGIMSRDKVKERFCEAVTLLLGRVENIEIWLDQFYGVRSEIVHEGRAKTLRYEPATEKKGERAKYHPLLSFGRQVFESCIPPILLGAHLAIDAKLAEKLVTNQARFVRLCKILDAKTGTTIDRLKESKELIVALDRYRFVYESGLSIETMLGSAKRAVAALLDSGLEIEPEAHTRLVTLKDAKKSDDDFEVLDALKSVMDLIKREPWKVEPDNLVSAVFLLLNCIWHYVFQYYFWIKEARTVKSQGGSTK